LGKRNDDYNTYEDQGNILLRIALRILSMASGGDKRMDLDLSESTRQEWPKEEGKKK
jgi:hypothetical protein